MQYLWLALLVLSALLESWIAKAVFLCFVPSALGALILAMCGCSVTVQVVLFFALAVCAFLFLRPLAMRFLHKEGHSSFFVESAIGMRTVVVERLDNVAGRGAITLDGMEWAARTLSDDIVIEEGSRVEIIAVEGVKFICREIKS